MTAMTRVFFVLCFLVLINSPVLTAAPADGGHGRKTVRGATEVMSLYEAAEEAAEEMMSEIVPDRKDADQGEGELPPVQEPAREGDPAADDGAVRPVHRN